MFKNLFREKTEAERLKAELREAYLKFERLEDRCFKGDGGRHISRIMGVPGEVTRAANEQAKKVNELAEKLKLLDPEFPKSWKPLQVDL